MAIDSKEKRKSAVNWIVRTMPDPDGSISQPDREHVAGLYIGISPNPPTSPTGTGWMSNYGWF